MSDEKHTYTCEGCGKTYEGTPDEAFQEGWDTPERFMSHCTCPNCGINTTIWWKLTTDPDHQVTEEEAKTLIGYQEIWRTRAHPGYKAIIEGSSPATPNNKENNNEY